MKLIISCLLAFRLATVFVPPSINAHEQPDSGCRALQTAPDAVWNEKWRCYENAERGIDAPVLTPTDYTAPRPIPINPTVNPLAPPTVTAGPDKTVFVNEPFSMDGSASSGIFDGVQTDGRYSDRWDWGYGGWTYEGGSIAPGVYPTTGSFTVTHTGCNSAGECASDTATVTVNAIVEGAVTTVPDTGNPVTNGTNLCNEVARRAGHDNPVIEVTAGVIYRG